MQRSDYLKRAMEAYDAGRIDGEVYDSMIKIADCFCDDEETQLPDTYAEIEYSDFDNAEARDGARWDDMNYLHYMER